MARFERSSRPSAGAPPTSDGRPRITMRLDPDGSYRPVEPEADTPAPAGDDAMEDHRRDVPPDAAGT